jgi:hypothetical protein
MTDTNKYQLGKIYKIVCNTTNKVYVGSTCEPTLAKRLANHKRSYKAYMEKKARGYATSFEIIGGNNYEIVLLENYPCHSRDELHKRERHYIETLECVNRLIPSRTDKEYREDNKELLRQQKKLHYQNNKDAYLRREKEYREANLEKVAEQHRIYQANNKEYISMKKKER